MKLRWFNFWKQISLVNQFMLAALAILLISMLLLGWWVGKQIETGVIHRISAETSLYVDSFVNPPLQELAQGNALTSDHVEMLNQLVTESPLGQHVVAFKVWDTHGRILYSTNPALTGMTFPIKDELKIAIAGGIVSDISDLKDAENLVERSKWHQLLETYSPITKNGTSEVIAVVEFYQTVNTLDREIQKAQISSWGLLGGVTLVVFMLLSIFVRRASNTIEQQRSQNAELNERVRRAALRTTTLNERFLRRISAELHDGPVQELGYALLRLDSIQSPKFLPPELIADGHTLKEEINDIETSLQHAIQEIRATSAGMGMPELDRVNLSETLDLVVRAHERRTGTQVDLESKNLPDQAPLPVKITLYRFVQEALNNSFQHAGGIGQHVLAQVQDGVLNIEVSDLGPGFDVNQKTDQSAHLGLSGMRERVESLGGLYQIESSAGQGTRIIAKLPLQVEGFNDEW